MAFFRSANTRKGSRGLKNSYGTRRFGGINLASISNQIVGRVPRNCSNCGTRTVCHKVKLSEKAYINLCPICFSKACVIGERIEHTMKYATDAEIKERLSPNERKLYELFDAGAPKEPE